MHTTYEQCLKEGVHFLQEWYLLDLVKDANGHVGGAVVWNMKEGRVEQIKAKAVILSTGGAGRIFWTRTTNPFLSTCIERHGNDPIPSNWSWSYWYLDV